MFAFPRSLTPTLARTLCKKMGFSLLVMQHVMSSAPANFSLSHNPPHSRLRFQVRSEQQEQMNS